MVTTIGAVETKLRNPSSLLSSRSYINVRRGDSNPDFTRQKVPAGGGGAIYRNMPGPAPSVPDRQVYVNIDHRRSFPGLADPSTQAPLVPPRSPYVFRILMMYFVFDGVFRI